MGTATKTTSARRAHAVTLTATALRDIDRICTATAILAHDLAHRARERHTARLARMAVDALELASYTHLLAEVWATESAGAPWQ